MIKEIVQLNGWNSGSHSLHPGDQVKVPETKMLKQNQTIKSSRKPKRG